jgi:hypothetical protein
VFCTEDAAHHLGKLAEDSPASSYWCHAACLPGTVQGPFSLFGCLRHAFKKAGRAFYRPRTTGTINLPPPGLRRTPSSLHDERIVGRVKFFTHTS